MNNQAEESTVSVASALATRILIVDDHALVAETVASVVVAQRGYQVTTCATVDEALDAIRDTGRFEVVLLDFHLPGIDGFLALRKMISANSGGVALFTGGVSRSVVERALTLGASGFIPKTLPIISLMNAIRFISAGETYLPSQYISGAFHEADKNSLLTRAELRVLMHLCEGLQNKEIAEAVAFTEATVKMHVKSICTKLGARNRTQAVLAAQRERLF